MIRGVHFRAVTLELPRPKCLISIHVELIRANRKVVSMTIGICRDCRPHFPNVADGSNEKHRALLAADRFGRLLESFSVIPI